MSYSSSTGDNWNDNDENYEFPFEKWDYTVSTWIFDDELDEDMITCPACDGRGMNRWEDDDCSECWGEGVVPRG